MANIREVARVAGVSTATVSRALSNPDRVSKNSLEKVTAAVSKVKYRPNMMARNFRAERAYSIVILVPSIDNPFYSKVIGGVEFSAQERGYSVLLGDLRNSLEREREYVGLVETNLADGVIQFRPSRNRSTISGDKHVPIVYAAGCDRTPRPSVRIDNIAAAKTLVDHLISRGHRRIAVLCGAANNPHAIDRLQGYKNSLAAASIEFDQDLVFQGQFSMASGVPAGQALASMKKPPTALFCMNDEMAIGAIKGLRIGGLRVPEDVAIVGFDNIDFSQHCDPSLTTIEQPAEEMGRIAGSMLIDMIEGKEMEEVEIVLSHSLIVRDSSG